MSDSNNLTERLIVYANVVIERDIPYAARDTKIMAVESIATLAKIYPNLRSALYEGKNILLAHPQTRFLMIMLRNIANLRQSGIIDFIPLFDNLSLTDSEK